MKKEKLAPITDARIKEIQDLLVKALEPEPPFYGKDSIRGDVYDEALSLMAQYWPNILKRLELAEAVCRLVRDGQHNIAISHAAEWEAQLKEQGK